MKFILTRLCLGGFSLDILEGRGLANLAAGLNLSPAASPLVDWIDCTGVSGIAQGVHTYIHREGEKARGDVHNPMAQLIVFIRLSVNLVLR